LQKAPSARIVSAADGGVVSFGTDSFADSAPLRRMVVLSLRSGIPGPLQAASCKRSALKVIGR
jgi:hypothetical protein